MNIEQEIQDHYSDTFINSLNLHLNEKNQINSSLYSKISRDEIIEHFERLKEKEAIIKNLKNITEDKDHRPKRH